MKEFIYLDNASTTYVYPDIITKINEVLTNNWGNPSNIYKLGFNSKEIIEGARDSIAKSINAKPENIFFTSGASEGNAWALKQGTKCLCSCYEHHNITHNENSIMVDEDYLERTLNLDWTTKSYLRESYKTWVYSHMLVSNETGEIFNVNPLFYQAKQLQMFTHCDMTQAIGNVSVDMSEYPYVDMATFSGHKIHAPKGVGFVYINSTAIPNIKPLLYGGIQESGIRAGTENIPYIAGLALAVKYAASGYSAKRIHGQFLREIAVKKLSESGMDYIIVEGKNNIPSTLTFCLKGVEGEVIQTILSDENVYIGTGSACGDGTMEISETLKVMNVPEEYIHGEIRLSFDTFNDSTDIIDAIERISAIYKELTK